MKCLKNVKSGEIIRVDEKQAYNMVGSQWSYVSKKEWKSYQSPKEEVFVSYDLGGPIIETKKIKNNKKSK